MLALLHSSFLKPFAYDRTYRPRAHECFAWNPRLTCLDFGLIRASSFQKAVARPHNSSYLAFDATKRRLNLRLLLLLSGAR